MAAAYALLSHAKRGQAHGASRRRSHRQLPDDVPVGPAEIIVLVGEPAPGPNVLDDFDPIEPASPVRLSDLVNEGRG
jgi:hypothetical protein